MFTYYPLRSLWKTVQLVFVPVLVVSITITLAFLFHLTAKYRVEQQLRERMLSTVSIASQLIDPELVQRVQTVEDMNRPAFTELTHTLQSIRMHSPNIRFVYMFRKTDNQNELAFVADADALLSADKLDTDNNGQVDSYEEPALTGDRYPIEESSVLADQAFKTPIVEHDFTTDQWGTLVSAYAPIFDERGEAIAVLGMDMDAREFYALSQNAFSVVALILVCAMGLLLSLYILYVLRSRDLYSLRMLDNERTAILDLAMHQLGMPLATFRWWLEILREEDGGKFCKRGGACEELQKGIDRMDAIVKSLHEASELHHYTVEKGHGHADVRTTVKEIVDDVLPAMKERSQKVKITAAASLPAVNIDAKLLKGVLREIIENASFYSKDGKTVTITAKKVNGHYVSICVQDQGVGIAQSDLPSIGEKFRRGKKAISMRPVGNGLGLFVVRRIISSVHGRFRVSSTEGKGTTICIELPIA